MFKIGDFSKLTLVSVRMLRYYDEVGLFKPVKVDNFTSYRYYSASQIEELNSIITLRDLGFNVAEIAKVLDEKSKDVRKQILLNKKSEIISGIEKNQLMLKKLDSEIDNIYKEKTKMNYKVEIKSLPAYKTITYRDIIPAYDQEGTLWHKLTEFVESNKIGCAGIAFAMYHDECYKESGVDVEVLMQVDKLGKSEDKYIYRETESVDNCASILVPGDYSNIGPAFNYLGQWIEENGYTICGNMRQVSIKGPWNEDKPENYLVEIQAPVAK